VIHPSAHIGQPPEHRDWKPGDLMMHPVIDPSAQINAQVTIDSGLRTHTTIGPRTLVMKSVHIGHDSVVGADCELAPHTVLGGHVVLGDRVRCGIGALVKPFVKVGDGARIGMGAVVLRDVPAGEVVVGNPAKPLR
jgi:acyl-[acyl carrier protein]--UDP-N-acetylglucosamine O-acyltransferase